MTSQTDDVAPLENWLIAEMWVVLITASIPPLWPLVRITSERISEWSSRHSPSATWQSLPFKDSKRPSFGSENRLVHANINLYKQPLQGSAISLAPLPPLVHPPIVVQTDVYVDQERTCEAAGAHATAGPVERVESPALRTDLCLQTKLYSCQEGA